MFCPTETSCNLTRRGRKQRKTNCGIQIKNKRAHPYEHTANMSRGKTGNTKVKKQVKLEDVQTTV